MFCSVPYSPFCIFMKRSDTNGCTYNDTIVFQVTNTILTKDLKCLPLTYSGNGNKSGWVGLLQEGACSSPRLGRRCLPGDTHSPSRTPVIGLPWSSKDGVFPIDHWVVWSVLDTVAPQSISSTENNNAVMHQTFVTLTRKGPWELFTFLYAKPGYMPSTAGTFYCQSPAKSSA